MLRASLRSVSDPLREHVCSSCLARGSRRPLGLRPFYSTAASLYPDPKKHKQDNSQEPKEPKERKEHKERRPSYLNPRGSKSKPNSRPKNSKPRKPPQGPPDPAAPGERTAPKVSKKTIPKSLKKTAVSKVSEQLSPTTKPKPKPKSTASATASETPIPDVVPPKAVPSKLPEQSSPKPTASDTAETPTPDLVQEKGTINSKDSFLQPLDVEKQPVPGLSFGLERVLFNPGVYQLRDPRSRVYNFDPYLGSIMPVTEFDFAALKEYITSSKDDTLRNIAKKEKKKYVGSTSSMTSVLSHFHYLLSAWRPVNTDAISRGFPDQLRTFTRLLRAPTAMFLKYQNGVYAIDADKEFDSANILMNLGKSMEKLLTLPKEDFERYRRSSANKISPEEEQAVPESYHYSTMGDFVMRSQLDAHDPRLPGTGMFDLKTRAVVSIRMDTQNFEHGLGYQIRRRYGAFESYEREFYDMIRAAFLKYSLQVRIGRMDGIFVAFHNIQRIFGFQYVSLPEMDSTLHGQSDTALGDHELRLSISLWNKVLDRVTDKFPKQSIRLHFETRDLKGGAMMYIFAEPVTEDEIHAIQTKNQEQIDAYQRRILNLGPHDAENLTPRPDESPDGSFAEPDTNPAEDSDNGKEVMGLKLLAKNIINGRPVERPSFFTENDSWDVEYEIVDMAPTTTKTSYQMVQRRRAKALAGRGEDETEVAANVYIRRLRQISQEGRAFREEEDKKDKEGLVVLDDMVKKEAQGGGKVM